MEGLVELSVRVLDLSHACIVTDLTLIVKIDRRVRLPLSQGRGYGVGFFSCLMKRFPLEFPSKLPRLHLPTGYVV